MIASNSGLRTFDILHMQVEKTIPLPSEENRDDVAGNARKADRDLEKR
jgi:hypothetical protein